MGIAKSHFYFFSYGSNLLLERIKARVPSVEIFQVYQLKGFRLKFNKVSKDGSTKANLQKTNDLNDLVWGVIQRIDHTEKPALDNAEGHGSGYELDSFDSPTDIYKIHYYIAKESKYLKEGNPYDWYLNYVIMGAIENNFPREYIKQLLSVAVAVDLTPESRKGYNKALTENIKIHKEINPEAWRR